MIGKEGHEPQLLIFNPLTLKFNKPDTNRLFSKERYKHDRDSFRLVLIIGMSMSIVYLFFDLQRFDDDSKTLIYRGGLALILALFLLISQILDKNRPQQLQMFGIFIALFTVTVGVIQNHDRGDNGLFLSNFMSSLIFVSCTIYGLRYRYVVLVNLLTIVTYVIFVYTSETGTTDTAFTQTPQLLTYFIIGLIAAYLLEKHRVTLFIKEYQLQQQVKKVADLNTVKDKLFSTIAHDIRGPVLNLKSVTELFNKGALTEVEIVGLMTTLDGQIGNTASLIDNLLAWSKTQLKGLTIHKSKYFLKDQLIKITDLYKTQIVEKKLHIILHVEDADELYADMETMFIVFRNLLSNAIKFTPSGGKITISGAAQFAENTYSIQFEDTGIGMDAKKLNTLFKIENSSILGSINDKGAGLGLTLVKEFIDLNEGEISCKSKTGQGTTFTILLPNAIA